MAQHHRGKLSVRLISDLHLAPVLPPQVEGERPSVSEAAAHVFAFLTAAAKGKRKEREVLVLAGDIGDSYSDPYRRLLVAARTAYTNVILVAGNHEFYTDGAKDISVVKAHLTRMCHELGVIFLDNADVVIHGVRFVGSTSWPLVPEEMFKVLKRDGYGLVTRITSDSHRLDFSDFKKMHDTDVRYLQEAVRASREPCVVVTHYPPSANMLDDRFEHSHQVALHYNAGLIELVARNTPLWLCGHCHTSKRFWVKGMTTLLAANCVEGGEYDPAFVVDI